MGIVIIFVRKKWSSLIKYWEGDMSNFENVSNEKKFDLKCSENKS